MTTLHDLPPELLHAIFASMEHEPPPRGTLVACSAVSHLWRDVALPYLFATLKARRRESFADVIPFLSTHPHIAACVKRLWLQRRGTDVPRPEVDHDTVHALLARLPALVNISFHTVAFVGRRLQVPSSPQTASKSLATQPISTTDVYTPPSGDRNGPYRLQVVLLYGCSVRHDLTPLFRILSLCEMETFRATLTVVLHHDSGAGSQVDLTTLHRPLRVRWLRVGVQKRQKSQTPLLEAFRRCLEPGCIRELDVACVDWNAIESAGALLRDVGCNLTTLRLNMLWTMSEDVALERWRAMSLASCAKLETFEFSFPPWDSILPDYSGRACANIVKLLPAGVQTIVLRLPELMAEAAPEYPRTLGLREIEEAVLEDRQGRIPELTRVVLGFVDYKADQFEAWATISSRVMPRLGREGLLHAACDR